VLGLQGAAAEHRRTLESLGVTAVDVRRPPHLDGVDALVIPGGESTTISMLLERAQLLGPVGDRLSAGMPALGTCAGMILLAADVADGRPDQHWFGAIDISVRRNGYGRQIDSFEADLTVQGIPGSDFRAVFIRAPVVQRTGPDVEVLACTERPGVPAHPVLCRQGPVVVSAFHPELTDDPRVHELWLDSCVR
jgi:pyridoxal 5'-phosphate synthase pdxT subunit